MRSSLHLCVTELKWILLLFADFGGHVARLGSRRVTRQYKWSKTTVQYSTVRERERDRSESDIWCRVQDTLRGSWGTFPTLRVEAEGLKVGRKGLLRSKFLIFLRGTPRLTIQFKTQQPFSGLITATVQFGGRRLSRDHHHHPAADIIAAIVVAGIIFAGIYLLSESAFGCATSL